MAKKRILSGMQPSGLLHLGNYFGALKKWIELQEEFDCFYFVADWHSLTTLYEDPSHIKQYTFEVAVDWQSAGRSRAKFPDAAPGRSRREPGRHHTGRYPLFVKPGIRETRRNSCRRSSPPPVFPCRWDFSQAKVQG